jgi:hypothetical protein
VALAVVALVMVLPLSARAASPSDQLAVADQQLVGHYEAGRTRAVKRLPLVMLVTPGLVTAYRYGKRTDYVVPARASIDLKAAAHAMLGFYGVLQPVAAGEKSAAQWAQVRSYRDLIARMPAMILKDRNIPSLPAGWATSLLVRLRGSADRALSRRSETPAQLARDERAVRPTVQRIFTWAGTTYAQSFLTTLRTVRSDAGSRAWHQAWAIVGASPAATRDNLETGIMIKALGPGALGHRLFLSQNTFDTKSLLEAISGLYYDQTLSETVFNSLYRMWRDLFAPVTTSLTGFGFYPQPATGR